MIIPLKLGGINCDALAHICGTEVPKEIGNARPHRLVTDSRAIEPWDIFCALKGNEDGHKYAGEAAKRGALCILAEHETSADTPHIIVPSVRRALADWAIAVSESDSLFRIGITGSVGKSTTKDAVFAMLSPHFKVHATKGNFNNDLGLPFTILSAPKETQILVCELGTNHKGEMAELSRILRPHLSVITCIGHAHIGAFGTREAIAREKLSILSYATDGSTLLVPTGEVLLSCLPPRGIRRTPVTPFTEEEYAANGISHAADDVARNFALGYAAKIGEILSLSKEKIKEGLTRVLTLETHRHEETVGDMLFIDDGYNASPESMFAALRYLASKSHARRVAVLGDMLELGEESDRYHRAVGRFAAKHSDRLFFFGAYAKEYEKGALGEGMKPADNNRGYSVLEGTREEIAKAIQASLLPDDAVLFKASRALQVEQIIRQIKKQIFER